MVQLVSASRTIAEGDSDVVFLRSPPFEYECEVMLNYTLEINEALSSAGMLTSLLLILCNTNNV